MSLRFLEEPKVWVVWMVDCTEEWLVKLLMQLKNVFKKDEMKNKQNLRKVFDDRPV